MAKNTPTVSCTIDGTCRISYSYTSTLYAYTGTISESSSDFIDYGPKYTLTWGGYNDGYRKYYHLYTGTYSFSYGKWTLPSGAPYATYRWSAWIPQNGGQLDGHVRYHVYGSSGYEVTAVVDQEWYYDEWIYIGEGYGNEQTASLYLPNSCVSSSWCYDFYEIWWDEAQYVR